MAVQDRNVHRDAQIARKALNALIEDPATVDEDEPIYYTTPRYNYRISDLIAYARVIATADITLRAKAVQVNGVVGQPALAAAGAVTFAIESFWQNVAGVLTDRAATAAQAFTDAFTVLEDGWGVVLIVVDAAGTITTRAASSTMGFGTEALALLACPGVNGDGSEGVVAVLTIEAVGGDFDATADNTDTANAFNFFDAGGHSLTLVVDTDPQSVNATLATAIKDPAGMRILDGRGDNDMLVISARSDGAAVTTEGTFQCEYRPSPIQGEGRGNESVSQTAAQFTP